MADEREQRARTWFFGVWAVIGVAVIVYAAWHVLRAPLAIIVPPLLLAGAVVYVLNPVVTWLARYRVPRIAGTALAYVVLIAAATAVGFFVGPIIARQVSSFAEQLPQLVANVVDGVNQQLDRTTLTFRLPRFDPQSPFLADAVRRFFSGGAAGGEQLQAMLSSAGGVVVSVVHVIAIIVLGPVLAFYLLYDLPDIGEGLRRLIPPDRREEVVGVAHGALAAVGGYFRGQLLVAAFVGLATTAGMWAIGLPFWGLVGIIAGVFNLIPAVGAFMAGAVGAVIALTLGDGMGQAVLVVVIETLVQQVDNHVITPSVQGRAVDLSPLTIVLALVLGGAMWGLVGALFIIPVLGALKVVALHVMAKTVPWALPASDPAVDESTKESEASTEESEAEAGDGDELVVAEPREIEHVPPGSS
ncbi:MAG: AI-2E family transporter [Nitriliruptorales bacterium]